MLLVIAGGAPSCWPEAAHHAQLQLAGGRACWRPLISADWIIAVADKEAGPTAQSGLTM